MEKLGNGSGGNTVITNRKSHRRIKQSWENESLPGPWSARKWREHESVKYSDRDGYISESDLPFYFLFFIFFNYFPFWETQKKVGRNLFFKIGKIWNNIRKKDFRGLTKFWLLIHRCVCKPRYWIDVAIFYWWVTPRYGDSIIALCPVQCWVGIPFCRG